VISRTNISVLIATALLGVLLWTVTSIVQEFGKIPDTPDIDTTAQETVAPDVIKLVSLTNRGDLETILGKHTTQVDERIQSYSDWLLGRGYPDGSEFWSEPIVDFAPEYSARDNASLMALAGNNDLYAMYVLAERRLSEAPLEALAWYDQAIVRGSIYAMLKTADTLEMIADPELQEFFSNALWRAALNSLNNENPPPLESALAWSLAAVTIGGYAILDQQHAGRISRLSARLDETAVQRACELAQQYLLDTAGLRRARGEAIFSTDQPPFALTAVSPDDLIPCNVSVEPLISFDECSAYPVMTATAQPASLWICPYSEV